MIKAVIFDMDGLMIDSEPFNRMAFNKALKDYRSGLSENENKARYIGITDLDAAEDMIKRKNLNLTKEELVRKKQEYYIESLKETIIVQPGLIDLLRDLKNKGIKVAVASSSEQRIIKIVIDRLKIENYVDFYCSGTEVKRGKPFPDVFLRAASGLKVDPKDCLVLEDAPKGVDAGKSAGMKVFAIPSRETKGKDFSNADLVLESLTEVAERL